MEVRWASESGTVLPFCNTPTTASSAPRAAGILWKSHEYAERAAGALRFTSRDLLEFGIVNTVVQEPLGGAHRDPHQMAARLKIYLVKTLRGLLALDMPTLLQQRYEKFRRMGVFLEDITDAN